MTLNLCCLVCDQPATRVCIHSQCEINPFVCSGKCKLNQSLSLTLHTHQGKTRFIPIKQFMNKTKQLQQKVNLKNFISYTTKQLKVQIEELKEFLSRYQSMFKGRQFKIKKNIAIIFENLKNPGKNHKLIGKQLHQLAHLDDIIDRDSPQSALVERAQSQIGEIIAKLESLNIENKLNGEKSDIHAKEGHKLFISMKFTQALKQFKLADTINPIDTKYEKQMKECELRRIKVESIITVDSRSESSFPANHLQKLSEIQKSIQNHVKKGCVDKNLFDKGMDCFLDQKYLDAIDNFSKAISINSNIAQYYRNRGNAYKQHKNIDKALQDYTKAIEVNPRDDAAYYSRGMIYSENNKDFLKAVSEFDTAISIDNRIPWYYSNRGLAYARLKNHKKAIQDLTQAIELDNKNSFNYSRRGIIFMKSEYYSKAIQDFTKAIKISPDQLSYKHRAEAYTKIGELKKAKMDEVMAQRT